MSGPGAAVDRLRAARDAGTSDQALAVHLVDLRRAVRQHQAEARAADAAPTDARRGGVELVRANIPGPSPATGRMGTLGLGAYAAQVWGLDIAPELKYVGARYAALAEKWEAGGLRATSIEATRVDNGGGREGVELQLTAIAEQLATARRALAGISGFKASSHGGKHRHGASARVICDALLIGGVSISAMLRRLGWCAKGKPSSNMRRVIVASLEAIDVAWGGHDQRAPDHVPAPLVYLAPDAAAARDRWQSLDAWHGSAGEDPDRERC